MYPVEGSPVLTKLIFIIMFMHLFIIMFHQYEQNRKVRTHLVLTQLQHKQIFKCNTKKNLKTNKIHVSIVGDLTLSGAEAQRNSFV